MTEAPRSADAIPNKFVLYQNNDIEVFVPNPPKIPWQEGVDIQVGGPHDSIDTPRQVLQGFDDTDNNWFHRFFSHYLGTLEATAIAMAVQALLAPGSGEIHNSNNWATGHNPIEEGGNLDVKLLAENARKEIARHRADIVQKKQTVEYDGQTYPINSFGGEMHVHLYIPRNPTDPVVLPVMSKGEAVERLERAKRGGLPTKQFSDIIEQWDKIPATTQEEIQDIRQKLGNNQLTDWLAENCQGKLRPN